jgi:hypothetical protein
VRRPTHSSNGNLDLHSGLERDRGDLLDDLGGRSEVDEALVDAHLVAVPSLGTFTTGAVLLAIARDATVRYAIVGWRGVR